MNRNDGEKRIATLKNKDQFLLAFQEEEEEEAEPQRPPQRKNTRSKHWKTASKPSRILFAENSLPETAPQTASELLPSPSQIDPEFLAALPDDVRQEIEQHYKRKDSHVTREDSRVTRVHIQTQPPGERVSERNTITFEAGDVQKKGKTQVVTAPKQVNFFTLGFVSYLLLKSYLLFLFFVVRRNVRRFVYFN